MVALLGCGVYLWVFDGPTCNPGRTRTTVRPTRRDFLTIIDEKESQLHAAQNRLIEFNLRAQELKRLSIRTLCRIQSLMQKETHTKKEINAIESRFRSRSNEITKSKQIHHDPNMAALKPRDVEPRSSTLDKELAAVREHLEVVRSDKQCLEQLHNRQIKTLRLAPIQLQLLRTQLTTLGRELRTCRERHKRLNEFGGDANAYAALCDRTMQATGKIEDSLAGDFGSVDIDVKELLYDPGNDRISFGGSTVDGTLPRTNIPMIGSRPVNAADVGKSTHPRPVGSGYSLED